jgi:predicted branched-subunit amino acid permease
MPEFLNVVISNQNAYVFFVLIALQFVVCLQQQQGRHQQTARRARYLVGSQTTCYFSTTSLTTRKQIASVCANVVSQIRQSNFPFWLLVLLLKISCAKRSIYCPRCLIFWIRKLLVLNNQSMWPLVHRIISYVHIIKIDVSWIWFIPII